MGLIARWQMRTLVGTSRTSADSGDYDAVVRDLTLLWQLRAHHLGREHRDTLWTAMELGTAHAAAGQTERAGDFLRENVRESRQLLGEHDFQVRESWSCLRACHRVRGIYTDVIPGLPPPGSDAYSDSVLTEGDEAPEQRRWIRRHMAVALRDHGDLFQAWMFAFDDYLTDQHTVHPSAHNVVVPAIAAHQRMNDYAETGSPPLGAGDRGAVSFVLWGAAHLRDNCSGDSDTVARLYGDVADWRERHDGPDSPATLNAHHEHAGQLLLAGHRDDSTRIRRSVLAARRRVLGDAHPDTLESAADVVGSLASNGDAEGAIAVGDPTVREHERTLGPDHPATQRIRDWVELAHQQSGRSAPG